MRNPFRYFNSSPEVIRLTVMLCIRYPLSLRQVEDLLFERGIDICHETVRLWWNGFGPMFAVAIQNRRSVVPTDWLSGDLCGQTNMRILRSTSTALCVVRKPLKTRRRWRNRLRVRSGVTGRRLPSKLACTGSEIRPKRASAACGGQP